MPIKIENSYHPSTTEYDIRAGSLSPSTEVGLLWGALATVLSSTSSLWAMMQQLSPSSRSWSPLRHLLIEWPRLRLEQGYIQLYLRCGSNSLGAGPPFFPFHQTNRLRGLPGDYPGIRYLYQLNTKTLDENDHGAPATYCQGFRTGERLIVSRGEDELGPIRAIDCLTATSDSTARC